MIVARNSGKLSWHWSAATTLRTDEEFARMPIDRLVAYRADRPIVEIGTSHVRPLSTACPRWSVVNAGRLDSFATYICAFIFLYKRERSGQISVDSRRSRASSNREDVSYSFADASRNYLLRECRFPSFHLFHLFIRRPHEETVFFPVLARSLPGFWFTRRHDLSITGERLYWFWELKC